MVIRRAEGRDAGRLTRLVRNSRAYEGRYSSMVEGYRVGPDYIEAHRVFVAVEGAADGAGPGGRATGREAGKATEPEAGQGTERVWGFYALMVEPGELDLMFVADQAQGYGIGRRLIGHMLDEARRAGLDSVRVVSHPPAEGFYRSMGARLVGTVPANPPAVRWDRPEFAFLVGSGGKKSLVR
ncbi:GNAT family N-acetyltransferase [Streptomyces tubercidicus]|uniref:GNAT family N-acetyltransferase n=1 Tax=Streptomyces tubercidicus TaxID=47759 RepID=UPI0013570A67|nr:GNAT family N-acetyltransferase [Streptomyces tubercidicus]WAU12952.1 GNAT family N-acetyltransferase [Streptomyces tubercidicus]